MKTNQTSSNVTPAAPALSRHEIDARLAARGFPARHRARLAEGLHGPGEEKARALLPKVIDRDALLLLVGARGPGKTQMATWWAAERIKAGKHTGHYRKTADLITEIKTTWRDGGKSVGTEDDVLRKYRETAYLVLDEFHERGSSDWEARERFAECNLPHESAKLGFPTMTVKDWKDLQSACKRVFALMSDGAFHHASAIIKASGQREGLRRMRELRGIGFTVEAKRESKEARNWLYRLVPNPELMEQTQQKQGELF